MNTNKVPEMIAGAATGAVLLVGGAAVLGASLETHEIHAEYTAFNDAGDRQEANELNAQLVDKNDDFIRYGERTLWAAGMTAFAGSVIIRGIRKLKNQQTETKHVARNQARPLQTV